MADVTITTESAPNSIRFSEVHPTLRLSLYYYYSCLHRYLILGIGPNRNCSVTALNYIFKDTHCYNRQSSFSIFFYTRPIGVEKLILMFLTSQHSHMPRSGLTLFPDIFSAGLRRYKHLPTGPLLRAASRLIAISATIVFVAPILLVSSLSIRATIAPSSSLLSFFQFSLQLRCASILLRFSLSVV